MQSWAQICTTPLENLEGRKNDSFILPSGKVISSWFLLDATYDLLLTYRNAVKDFCLIQDNENTIRLQIVPDNISYLGRQYA